MNTPTVVIHTLIILALAGSVSPKNTSTCFAQSPWTQIADMQVAKNGHSASFLDGKLYVMGGVDHYSANESEFALHDLDVYDPLLDSWTEKADMLTRRFKFSSCAYDGKILAIGGSQDIYWTPVSAIDAYDPLSDTWIHLTDIPKAGVWQAAVLLDDKIYVLGGAEQEPEFPYSTVQVYNLLTDTWTEAADMPTPRSGHSAVALQGKIYVLGGQQGKSNGYLGLNAVEEFDPETNTWVSKAAMIFPRKLQQSISLDDKVYVFGGVSGMCSGGLNGGEIYDPQTNSWRELYHSPRILGASAASKSNGKVYIGGGQIGACEQSIRQKSWYIYDPYYDLRPYFESIVTSKFSIVAGADTVILSTYVDEPAGISLIACLHDLDGFPMDSVQLFDDGMHQDNAAGDGLYANAWIVSSEEELQYTLNVQITRMDSDTVTNYFDSPAIITTKGLVTLIDYAYDPPCPDPGDWLRMDITVKNNSSNFTATNIEARLTGAEGLLFLLKDIHSFEDIPPGESSTSAILTGTLSENCPKDTVLPLLVNLSSFGQVLRTDTLLIVLSTVEVADHAGQRIAIYPNPVMDKITIEMPQSDRLRIELHSISGREIYRKELEGDTQQLDLSSLHKGIYFITIRSENFVTTRKIIKM